MPHYLQRVAIAGAGTMSSARPPGTGALPLPRASREPVPGTFALEEAPVGEPAAAAQAPPREVAAPSPLPAEAPLAIEPVAAIPPLAPHQPHESPKPSPIVPAETQPAVVAPVPERSGHPEAPSAPALLPVTIQTAETQHPQPESKEPPRRVGSLPRVSRPEPASGWAVRLPSTLPVGEPERPLPSVAAKVDLRPAPPRERVEAAPPTPIAPVTASEPTSAAEPIVPPTPASKLQPPRVEPGTSPADLIRPVVAFAPGQTSERMARIHIGQVEVSVQPQTPAPIPAAASASRAFRTDPLEARFLHRFRLWP